MHDLRNRFANRKMTRGFTLVELLVVITIGFVILVILFFLVALMVWVGRHAFT